jgi:hypothetical protein
MTNPTNPTENPTAASPTDDEMLDILRRVQSGELSAEQAEELLGAVLGEAEERGPSDTDLDSQTFSAPLGKSANGKLIFERGAAGLTLRGEALPGQLFTAFFERHVPVVRVNGSAVTVRYRDFGFGLLNWLRYGFNPPRGEMVLNAAIPWQIDIHSGLAQSGLDLSAVKLRRLTIHHGISEAKFILSEPNGSVKLDCHGGVHNLMILRPPAVPVRLSVHGGAANLTLDSQTFGAVSGPTTLETPNLQATSDYYTITVHGGAHNFRVAGLSYL